MRGEFEGIFEDNITPPNDDAAQPEGPVCEEKHIMGRREGGDVEGRRGGGLVWECRRWEAPTGSYR